MNSIGTQLRVLGHLFTLTFVLAPSPVYGGLIYLLIGYPFYNFTLDFSWHFIKASCYLGVFGLFVFIPLDIYRYKIDKRICQSIGISWWKFASSDSKKKLEYRKKASSDTN